MSIWEKIEIQFCFRFFSKSVFSQKNPESPPFLRHATSDPAEIFFVDTRHRFPGGVFFISKNIALAIFGRFYKICPSRKISVFYGISRILAFFLECNRIKRNKKYPPCEIVSSSCKRKFQLDRSYLCRRSGGEKLGHF